MERCRCGRYIDVSLKRSESGEKQAALITKVWYDKDGNVERITGNGAQPTPKDPPVGI